MLKDVLQKLRLHPKDPLQIHGYQTYGTSNHLYMMGRALEDEGVDLDKTGFASAFKNAYKQFKSDELADAKLKIRLPDDRVFYAVTDKDLHEAGLVPRGSFETFLHHSVQIFHLYQKKKKK